MKIASADGFSMPTALLSKTVNHNPNDGVNEFGEKNAAPLLKPKLNGYFKTS